MQVRTNVPISSLFTMRLGGTARFVAEVTTKDDVKQLAERARSENIPIFVLGGGSNVIARDEEFSGILVHNRIPGTTIVADDVSGQTLRFGAGENWDEIVRKSVEANLSGIEAMSAIPGTIGAAPVQNIGAYGQELADTFVELEAYDCQAHDFVTLGPEECQFSYRDSIFRGEAKGRYIIVSVTLKLYKTAPKPPFYAALQTFFDAHNITIFTPKTVRDAVMQIRFEKLPDPSKKPNSGSFFKNAIVETWQFDDLKKTYPDIPSFKLDDNHVKIPTGWLIEQTGMKGKLLHGMRVHDTNCLVLINESAECYADLDAARTEIMRAVFDTFRIAIVQEPLEL